MKQMKMIFHKDGTVTVKMLGFSGEECRQHSSGILQRVGNVTSDESTDDGGGGPIDVFQTVDNG